MTETIIPGDVVTIPAFYDVPEHLVQVDHSRFRPRLKAMIDWKLY